MRSDSASITPGAALLLEAMQQPLVVCDRNKTIAFANSAFCNALALGDVDAGLSLFELDDARWDVSELRELFDAGPSLIWAARRFELAHPALGHQTVFVSAKWVCPSEQESHLVLLSASDVSEQRRAEEQAQLAWSAFESSSDSMVCATLDGTILCLNAAAERLYGLTREEAINQCTTLLVPAEDASRLVDAQARVLQSRCMELLETRGRQKGAETTGVTICVSPTVADGVINGIALIVRDAASPKREREEIERMIAQRTRELEAQRKAALEFAERAEMARLDAVEAAAALKRADVQLRQSQKMESIGKLAGGVAHDFNNLLTAILSFSGFVMKTLDPSDQAYRDMMEVTGAAKRAVELTGQLLAFSQKRTIEPEVIDLNQKLLTLERMLERLLTEDIELVSHLDAKAGTIRVDLTALEQIVVNLAVNAKDAMPQGGRLVIETAVVTLDEGYGAVKGALIPPGDYVTLSLSDTGLGMDETTRQHIFEPFFTTKEVGKGTGLGLSTVYGIVKQAGGFIWVYSEVGQGTTFRVYFPRIDAEATTPRTSFFEAAPTGSETILVVEDDERIRRLCARALSPLGYRVLVAGSGSEGLACGEREGGAIDLLLTDVVMPRMSGKQLALRLGQICPGVKVLFMSGYTSNVIVHHGVVDDGVVLLQKPFTIEGIARKVREVLDSDAYYGRDFSTQTPKVLLVEEDLDVQAQVRGFLDGKYELFVTQTGEEALARIKSSPPDAVICACKLSGIQGSELYQSVRALTPHLSDRFLFTASGSDGDRRNLLFGIDRPLLRKPIDERELRDALEFMFGGKIRRGARGAQPPEDI